MSFDFPLNPALNEEAFFGPPGARYIWDGQKWRAQFAREVFDPVPLIWSISPTQANQNEAFTLTVSGSYFAADTVVTLDGVDVATTYVSMAELTAAVPAQPYNKTSVGVNVRSTARSNADVILTLVDRRIPVMTSVSPLAGVQNEAVTLTVRGSTFKPADRITINSAAVATTYVSDTELTTNYTCPYFAATELGQVDISVSVTDTLSPPLIVNFIDPRFKIRSTYPDYYSEWTPNVNHIEVWGWGLMAADSVVYIDRNGGAGPEPRSTWIDPNAVGTELILVFDINPAPEYDTTAKLTVLNKGIHWSAGSWDFWCEDIG